MSSYASNTQVSTSRSLDEIDRVITRYGADRFMYGRGNDSITVAFSYENWQVRFDIDLPNREDKEFSLTPTGKPRSATASAQAWEQACRQRYRALLLVIKAKLEAIESGISTFEQEFFANLVLPGGQTVYRHMSEPVSRAISGDPNGLLQLEM